HARHRRCVTVHRLLNRYGARLSRMDADLARIGTLLADPKQARMLLTLLGGTPQPASALADGAGASPPLASAHLRKLVGAGRAAGSSTAPRGGSCGGRRRARAGSGPGSAWKPERLLARARRAGRGGEPRRMALETAPRADYGELVLDFLAYLEFEHGLSRNT